LKFNRAAFVVCADGQQISADELRAFCVEKLADYKIPRKYSFVDSLPRTPMAKILKSELRKMALQDGTV